MTRRIMMTILAVVLGSTLIVGVGTTLLSYRSTRQQTRADVASLTRNLAELARFSRTVPLGISQDCDAIVRPARKRACEAWLANAGEAAADMIAERERLRLGYELEGIAFISYDVTRSTVLDGDGNPVDSAELPEPLTAEDIPFDRVIEGETVDGVRGTVAFAAAATRLEAKPNWAIVVVATRGFEPLFGPTFRWFLLSALVALVAAVAASWSLANKLSRPIHAATDVAQRIADGDLSARIRSTGADPNPASPDELERLAAAIDSMADSLERSRGLEQQFLMSVSHDLRTPLTNIGGWAEAITDGAAAEPARAAAIIGRESQRLNRLVDDLLDLAKLNSNEFRYQLGVHDLRSLAETTVHGFEAEAAAAGIRISLADPGTATATATAPAGVVAEAISAATPVRVDADRAQQVLGNLMANALKYAHSAITVQVDVVAPNVSLSVIDDGPGIAAEDLPHVFERLYRANARPTRSESGSGLGLAIVDQLVRGMHGTVEVASDGASGTRFTVTFPLADG